jgi:hypothetical protein
MSSENYEGTREEDQDGFDLGNSDLPDGEMDDSTSNNLKYAESTPDNK